MTPRQVLMAIFLGVAANLVTGLFLQPLAGRSLRAIGRGILSLNRTLEDAVFLRIARRDTGLGIALIYGVISILAGMLHLVTFIFGTLADSPFDLNDLFLRAIFLGALIRFIIEIAIVRFTEKALFVYEHARALAKPVMKQSALRQKDSQFASIRSRDDYDRLLAELNALSVQSSPL